jgi:hypothetical protein
MCLHIHSDASHLSERKATSQSSSFVLSSFPEHPAATPDPDGIPPPDNGAVHVRSAIMKPGISSATEDEARALFFNRKEAITFRTTFTEMGWPQPPTLVQTENCAAGITSNTLKQSRSKAIDMPFY